MKKGFPAFPSTARLRLKLLNWPFSFNWFSKVLKIRIQQCDWWAKNCNLLLSRSHEQIRALAPPVLLEDLPFSGL
jgi:hypothetical protein